MSAVKHGTTGGYQRHRRNGEPPCGPCKAARAEYMRQYRTTPVGERAVRREAQVRQGAIAELIERHADEFRHLLTEWRKAVQP